MGRIAVVTGLLAWASAAVAAPEVRVVQLAGPVGPGEVTTLEIGAVEISLDDESMVPVVSARGGEVRGAVTPAGPGRWRVFYRTPDEGQGRVTVSLKGISAEVTVTPQNRTGVALSVPGSVPGHVGREVSIRVLNDREESLSPSDIEVVAPEGQVLDVEESDQGVMIRWKPGTALFPRAVPILIRDRRSPRRVPAKTVVRLRARPTIPVRTEVGAKVKLSIQGRTVGSTTAGTDGVAAFVVEVRPGESVADVSVTDDLGNSQTSQIALGGDPRPGMVLTSSGAMIVGRPPPEVWLYVVEAAGEPWNRGWPTCRGGDGERLVLRPHGVGLWRAYIPESASSSAFDVRIACSLRGLAESSLRVPIERMHATRLVVRTFPSALSADVPVAEVQAFLENAVGDRLPANGIELQSELGDVQALEESTVTLLRAVYDGSAAASTGGDIIRATWSHLPGSGGIWDLGVRGAREEGGGGLVVDARAVNHSGQPIGGHPLVIRAGGRSARVMTGEHGWATTVLPWPEDTAIPVVAVAGGGLQRQRLVLPGDQIQGTVGTPDLVTELSLEIRPGRVHSVLISPEPRVLSNSGQVGRIVVRLKDKLGNPVTGQEVQVASDIGIIGPVRSREDGGFEATFAPPIGMPFGKAQITASTADGRFSAATEVEVVPREMLRSIGLSGGYIVGARGLDSPWASLELDHRWGKSSVFLRGRVGIYGETVEARDDTTKTPVTLSMRAFPLSAGVYVRRSTARIPVWVGSQLVVAPYTVSAQFGNSTRVDGLGVSTLGAGVFTGMGWSVAGGELQGQVEYLFAPVRSSSVGWQGSVGGVVGTLGFKVLY